MNTRILDLIKNPESVKIADLELLTPKIEKMPYMQSLRAIYLLGVHQFYNDKFQTELTKTAAYTTDKKILYHFINQNKTEFPSEEIKVKNTENISIPKSVENEISVQKKAEIGNNTEPYPERKEEIPTPTGINFYTKNIKEKPKYELKKSVIDFYTQPTKENKVESKNREISSHTSPIDFYTKTLKPQKPEENTEKIEKKIEITPISEEKPTEIPEWKPMQLETFSPTKNIEFREQIIKTKKNVTNNILPKEDEKENAKIETKTTSNVSTFINTWQNWLKIERTPKISEQEKKAAIIDRFIENNPKISPIRDDIDFVVKEKSDDISHLMTETLALLYIEQRLYSKAINAYKILQEKYPERTEEFEQKIEEIKKSKK